MIIMENYFYIILIFILYLILSVFVREKEGSWFSPASLMILLWTFITGFSIFLAPDYYYSPLALIYIFSTLLTFYLGGNLFDLIVKDDTFLFLPMRKNTTIEINVKLMFLLVILGILTGFATDLLLIMTNNIKFSELGSFDTYVNVASKLSAERFSGKALDSKVLIGLTMSYFFMLVTGMIFSFSKNKFLRAFCFTVLIPLLIFTILSTSRQVFLFGIIFFSSSYIAGKIYLKDYSMKLFTKINLKTVLVISVLIPVLFITTQTARMGGVSFSPEDLKNIIHHLKPWFFGNLSGFSAWFDNTDFDVIPTFAKYTIGGIYEALGFNIRKLGAFNEYFYINDLKEKTNIFTIFRCVIEDYTLLGSYLFFLAGGFVAKLFFFFTLRRKIIGIAGLSLLYSLIFWSFVISIIYYNSVIFSFALFLVFLFCISLISKFRYESIRSNNIQYNKEES